MMLSRRSTIKTLGVVGAGSTLTGTALAVGDHQDDERDPDDAPADDEAVGAIRVAHVSPDAPNVDVYVDDEQILSDVAYGELSPYLEIAPGTYTMAITAAGDPETIVYEETVAVDAYYYTAAALGELEADEEALEADAVNDGTDESAAADGEDDEEAPVDGEDDPGTGTFDVLLLVDAEPDDVEEDTSPIRVVHASPDTPTVDIADAETRRALFEDVGYTEPSGYVPVEPGDRTLELFPAGENDQNGELADDEDDGSEADNETDDEDDVDDDLIAPPEPIASATVDLEEGLPYTVYAIGYRDADEMEAETTTDGDSDDDSDDRSFDIVVAIDGTMDAESDDLEPEEDDRDDDSEADEEGPETEYETDDEYDDDGGEREPVDA